MKDILERAIEAYDDFRLDEAEELLLESIDKKEGALDVTLSYLGRIKYKNQKFGEAINCYNRALEINPDNDFAKTGITLINQITAIGNSFYFENAYTDDELIPNL